MVRKSTDAGRSWGQLANIFDAIGHPAWKHINADGNGTTIGNDRDTGNAVWDPTPVYDEYSGKVWVFFNGPGRESEDCHRGWCATWAMSSTDRGSTWSTAANLTAQCQRAGVYRGVAGNTPGNGHGVQLSSGRLVIPMCAAGLWPSALAGGGGGRSEVRPGQGTWHWLAERRICVLKLALSVKRAQRVRHDVCLRACLRSPSPTHPGTSAPRPAPKPPSTPSDNSFTTTPLGP